MRVSCSTSVILDVTLTGAARSQTHFVRLDGAEVLRVAFPVARRRRRPRLHSQIATAVSQTSPDLKERRAKKRWERVRDKARRRFGHGKSSTGTGLWIGTKVAVQTLHCYCVCCELLSASIADALWFVNMVCLPPPMKYAWHKNVYKL